MRRRHHHFRRYKRKSLNLEFPLRQYWSAKAPENFVVKSFLIEFLPLIHGFGQLARQLPKDLYLIVPLVDWDWPAIFHLDFGLAAETLECASRRLYTHRIVPIVRLQQDTLVFP